MAVELAFGKGSLLLNLPPHVRPTVIRKSAQPPLSDPRAAVRRALDLPTGTRPMKELAQRRRDACILICDITRPVPNHLFLRAMVEDLLEAGVPAERIRVLVATGLHRPNQGDELVELVGDPWVLSRVRVENHFARNDQDHVSLGLTRTGTPVKLDRRFVQADLRIVTGLIEPHFMAGYSGGRKLVAPGIAHAETICTLHNAHILENPLARASLLAGNPLHQEQLEIIGMIGEIYGLNVVLNERRELVYVNFGEVVRSHSEAVEVARDSSVVDVPQQFSTVVTSSAGYPLDKTYYQTVKGMVAPLPILKPGGTLIIASECSEGLGSPDFQASQQRMVAQGPDTFLKSLLNKSLANVDEWQTEMQLKATRQARVQLYTTGLTEEERRWTGVEVIESIVHAIEHSVERSGDREVAIIPEGPYVTPIYAESLAAVP